MKKQLLLLVMILLPMVASADTIYLDGIGYNIITKAKIAEVILTGYGYSGDVAIPDSITYNGERYSVTTIKTGAFSNQYYLTSVTIGNCVTTIEEDAFKNCSRLSSVILGKNVAIIGRYAFKNCTQLQSIHIIDKVTSICVGSFEGCTSLTSITIPDNVLTLEYDAFKNCTNLKTAYIGNGITILGSSAFEGCTSLSSVTLGENITSIGHSAFRDCKSLNTITIPENVTEIWYYAFKGSSITSIIIPEKVTMIEYNAFENCTSLTNVIIKGDITILDKNLFSGCTNLKEVNIEGEVKKIRGYAFSECTSLESVTLPNTVNEIYWYAFSNCKKLSKINMSDNLNFIGSHAFIGCSSLTSLNIPNSVTTIDVNAFENCDGLESITIGNGITSIQKRTFYGCTKVKSIILGNNVAEIGDSAFFNCSSLENLTLPQSVTSIGIRAFWLCNSLESISLGNNIKKIGNSAFAVCMKLKAVHISDLNAWLSIPFNIENNPLNSAHHLFLNGEEIKTLSIPDNVTKVGDFSFYGCDGLTSVIFPNSVEHIGSFSFSGCKGLTSISIGKGIKIIDYSSFSYCENLSDVYCYSKEVPNTSKSAFNNSYIEYASLHVPEISMDSYKDNEPWKNFKEIVKIDMPKFTLTYILDGETYKTYEIEEDETITPETAPTKEGYTFSGWSEIPTTMPAHDVTVTGTFSINKYKLIYKVDGTEYKSYEIEYGASITPEEAPTKEGYTFSGWSEIPATMPAHDVTVTGTFSINKYKLIYKVDGVDYKSYEIEYGATITPETAPTKEGYTFSGWSEIPTTMPAHDVTVTGTFSINKYKLIYKVDGAEYKSYEIEFGATITPEEAPTKEGYTFSGWSEIPTTMPAHDVTVTGTFSINKYKLIYKVDGVDYKSYEIEYGATITPEPAPTKEGYTFSGWSEIPATMPAHDVTVTGTFTQVIYVVDNVGYEVKGDNVSVVDGSNYSGEVVLELTVVINGQSYAITAIADAAFKGNQNITSVTIPNSVTSIGESAFEGCNKLITINIGNAVASIESKAFANMNGASQAPRRASGNGLMVQCNTESIPSTASDAFVNTPIDNAKLLVLDNLKASYMNTTPWSGFGTIMGINEYTGIDAIIVDIESGAKIYSLDGKPQDTLQKGVNIVRTSNGKTKKVVVK